MPTKSKGSSFESIQKQIMAEVKNDIIKPIVKKAQVVGKKAVKNFPKTKSEAKNALIKIEKSVVKKVKRVVKKAAVSKKTVSSSKLINIEMLTKQLAGDISSIRIQGATNIAIAILKHLKTIANNLDINLSPTEFIDKLSNISDELSLLRATEPMARNAVHFFKSQIKSVRNTNTLTVKKMANETVDDFLKWVGELDGKMVVDGYKIIKNGQKVLTHCHSSTAESVLIEAHKKGRKFHAFNTETRPLYQGHTTSKHLLDAGIPTTLIVDDSAEYLISEYSGKEVMMNIVIIGCDAISLDGSCVNKVGSFGIAQSAYYEGVDVYVAASLLKLDVHAHILKEIKIEFRNSKEIWPQAPKDLKIINFAFDRVPAKFIKGYITEFGIIKPKNIHKMAKRNYNWMFK